MTTIHTIERRPRVAPHANSKPPLLLLLHGYGASEHDLFDLADYLDPRLHIVSARAVIQLGFGGYAWYQLGGAPGNLIPEPTSRAHAVELLQKFIAALPDRIGSDPRRTYLLGFSQGAALSLAMAMTIPDRLAGVIACSGYLDTAMFSGPAPEALSGLPILQQHGTHDEVIPVMAAHRTAELLAATPARHAYHEYPIGHSIHLDGLRAMQEWLKGLLDIT